MDWIGVFLNALWMAGRCVDDYGGVCPIRGAQYHAAFAHLSEVVHD